MSEATIEPLKDYSWAEYLDYMEGGPGVGLAPSPKTSPVHHSPLYGLALTFGLTVVAIQLSEAPFWPFTLAGNKHPIEPVMVAIILGMVICNIFTLPKSFAAGLKFSVKKILPLGIILLGARLDFRAILGVGFIGVVLTTLETMVAFGSLLWLSRRFRLPRKLGILLGVGTAICGGSAIVATAPVIEAEEKDVVFAIATVTLLSLISMFTLPLAGHLIGMTPKAFGVWMGLVIHQMPAAIAAGFAYSPDAGTTATIVKLARVCLLAPVVFIVGCLHARGETEQNGLATVKKINYLRLFPMFTLGFLALALVQSLHLLPVLTFSKSSVFGATELPMTTVCDVASKYCIVISMAAMGLETKVSAMKQTGPRPFLASLVAAAAITVLLLILIRALGIA